MKSIKLLSTVTLLAALAGCGSLAGFPGLERDPADPAAQTIPTQAEVVIVPSSHSACLQPEEVQPGGIQVSVSGSSLRIVDPEAMFNCCLEPVMDLRLEGDHIIALEHEAGDGPGCNCVCSYELSAEIQNLPAGSYLVSVFRGDETQPVFEQSVAVAGSGEPVIRDVSQSQCLSLMDSDAEGDAPVDEPGDEPLVEVQVDGHLVTVTDLAFWNCCALLQLDAWVAGSTVQVLAYEDPESEPCDCICPFELSMELELPAPGTYTIEVYHGAFDPAALVHAEQISI